MSTESQKMVRIRFEGKGLDDCDLWTTSGPFLILSRPARNGCDWFQVHVFFLTVLLDQKTSVMAPKSTILFNHVFF